MEDQRKGWVNGNDVFRNVTRYTYGHRGRPILIDGEVAQ